MCVSRPETRDEASGKCESDYMDNSVKYLSIIIPSISHTIMEQVLPLCHFLTLWSCRSAGPWGSRCGCSWAPERWGCSNSPADEASTPASGPYCPGEREAVMVHWNAFWSTPVYPSNLEDAFSWTSISMWCEWRRDLHPTDEDVPDQTEILTLTFVVLPLRLLWGGRQEESSSFNGQGK